jgi:hypothetical protein
MGIFRKKSAEASNKAATAAENAAKNDAENFAQKHLFRTADGVHTAQDLKLFEAVNALARAHGMPRQDDNGSCRMRPVVMNKSTLRVEFNGYNPSVDAQAKTFASILAEAGLHESSISDNSWLISKEGSLFHEPCERDYYGHYVDVDLAANGGEASITQKLERAVQDKAPRHAARVESQRNLPSTGSMWRG